MTKVACCSSLATGLAAAAEQADLPVGRHLERHRDRLDLEHAEPGGKVALRILRALRLN